ncbi:MAG: glycosyltransferase family 4 protein, partial [Patescibacteria group bacterium]
KKIKWDIPLLEGYKYKFLKNFSLKPSSEFWGQINLGIIKEIYDLRFKNYNGILIFGWNSFTNWMAFLTAFILGLPVFLRGENPLNQELLKPKWKIKIKKVILGNLFKRISAFLYIGEENKKFYQYYGVSEEKLFFVPYAVDNERYIAAAENFEPQKQKFRNELGIKQNDGVILFGGKLIEKKRPMDLLMAYELLSKIKNQKIKIHLVFMGDGALRLELEKYVEENNLKNIHFVGFKNQTELPKYYAMADVFILPSGVGETWGLMVNEAMCFGLPVIVSDIVGCGFNLVKQGENGYIFPLGNVERLADYLTAILENFNKRILFGEKSFSIIQKYNYENDIKGILKAIICSTK